MTWRVNVNVIPFKKKNEYILWLILAIWIYGMFFFVFEFTWYMVFCKMLDLPWCTPYGWHDVSQKSTFSWSPRMSCRSLSRLLEGQGGGKQPEFLPSDHPTQEVSKLAHPSFCVGPGSEQYCLQYSSLLWVDTTYVPQVVCTRYGHQGLGFVGPHHLPILPQHRWCQPWAPKANDQETAAKLWNGCRAYASVKWALGAQQNPYNYISMCLI